jgi:cellulose synthase/poly-beta-1,6-N-acetylglucosamine synthase-like glycosyltransferase
MRPCAEVRYFYAFMKRSHWVINRQGSSLFLSIVIPAYNEESRLPQTLPQVAKFVEAQDYDAEVLVVDDGSTDRTTEIVEEIATRYPCVRLIRVNHGGKGHAVKSGMLQVRGEYAFLCDADLAMPITELPKFLPPCQNGYQICDGSGVQLAGQNYSCTRL